MTMYKFAMLFFWLVFGFGIICMIIDVERIKKKEKEEEEKNE